MRATRIQILTALAGAAAMGLAAPASAELVDGNYEISYIGDPSPPQTMVATSCGAGCKHIQIIGAAPGGVDFHLQGNTWTGHASGATVTIDDATLSGSSAGNALQLVKVG